MTLTRGGTRVVAGAGALVLLSGPLTAQTAAEANAAAETITAASLADHLRVLSQDSLRGSTPSPALERTAQYLATEFARLGLRPRPLADSTAERATEKWLVRYAIPGQSILNADESYVHLSGADTYTSHVSFASAAYAGMPWLPSDPNRDNSQRKANTVLIAGPHTPVTLQALDLKGKLVLYVPPATLDSVSRQAVIDRLSATSLGVIVTGPADSAAFAQAWQAAQRSPTRVVDYVLRHTAPVQSWVVYVSPGAIASTVTGVGVELGPLAAATTPVARPLPLEGGLQLATRPAEPMLTAPNVIARLEGRDSALRNQYLLLLAHMDATSARPGPLDSLVLAQGHGREAHDNTVGVAGLLELARAFSQPNVRPRRSLLFLATSGGAQPGFWGASDIQTWGYYLQDQGTVVSTINLDHLGRRKGLAADEGDSVLVAGLREVDSIAAADWIAAAHPELQLRVVDGGTAFAPTSDHFGLIGDGKPTFYVHANAPAAIVTDSGSAPPAAGGDAALVDADWAARVMRLVFYLGLEIGNTTHFPRLNAAGRRHFLDAMP